MSPRLRVPISPTDHRQGPETAPMVLVEYGDYECPFCGKAYAVIKRLQEDLGDDLLFVFRNFPLGTAHPHAMDAARAAESAGLQGKFWEMHDLLYENQDDLDLESILDYATFLDLDLHRFIENMNSQEVDSKIVEDLYGGAKSGVSGTPGFFINGERFDGDWSYDSLWDALTASQPRARKAA